MYKQFLLFLSGLNEGDWAVICCLFLVIFLPAVSWAINVLMFSKEE